MPPKPAVPLTPEVQGMFTPSKSGTRNTSTPFVPLPPTPGTSEAPGRPRNTIADSNNRVTKSGRDGRTSRPRSRRAAAGHRPRDPEFTAQLQSEDIQVLQPGDLEYERAVASSNLLYRFSRPTYVLRPQNTGQVRTIVAEAFLRKLPITIKNGGHSYTGSSFPKDGIMLDMKDMNKVSYNRDTREMTIQGGALWGNVYRALIEEGDGLLVNGGRCPSVGVSGFILGGGIGPFSRKYGMAVDNLNEVTIVTAPDGEVYTVSSSDDPDSDEGMLFWALSGAGGGNFGVVVEIKIGAHKLTKQQNGKPGEEIVAGRHTWFPSIERSRGGLFGFTRRPEESTGLLATMNHFYATNWPDQMTIDSSWFSDLQIQNGDIAVRFLAYYDGKQEDFDRLIQKGVLNADLSKQLKRRALPELSTRFLHETLFAQWDEETKRSTPANSSFRVFHSFCFTNEPAQIEKITAIIKEELEAFKILFTGEDRGLCQVSWIHAGGQTTRRDRSATAFRWRETVYHTYIMVQWNDKWLERDMRGFARKFKNRLRQFSIAGKAAFVNFPDSSLPKTDHMKAYYGNNRQKLQQVKHLWDEHNFFKWDQGIDATADYSQEAVDDADINSRINEMELSDGEEEGPDQQTDLVAKSSWEERRSVAVTPLLTLAYDTLGERAFTGGDNVTGGPPGLGFDFLT